MKSDTAILEGSDGILGTEGLKYEQKRLLYTFRECAI
jgi:hypothetical protein